MTSMHGYYRPASRWNNPNQTNEMNTEAYYQMTYQDNSTTNQQYLHHDNYHFNSTTTTLHSYPSKHHQTWYESDDTAKNNPDDISEDDAFDLTVASVIQSVFDTDDSSDRFDLSSQLDDYFLLNQSSSQVTFHRESPYDESLALAQSQCLSARSTSSVISLDHTDDECSSLKLSTSMNIGQSGQMLNIGQSWSRTTSGSLSSSIGSTPPVSWEETQSPQYHPAAGQIGGTEIYACSNNQPVKSNHDRTGTYQHPEPFSSSHFGIHGRIEPNNSYVDSHHSHRVGSSCVWRQQRGGVRVVSAITPVASNGAWDLSPLELGSSREQKITSMPKSVSRSVPSSPHCHQSAPSLSPVYPPAQFMPAKLTPARLMLIESQSRNHSNDIVPLHRKDSLSSLSTDSSTTPSNNQSDSPTTRSKFQIFSTEFWSIERSLHHNTADLALALQFGLRALLDYNNQAISWRIALELADFCKRRNLLKSARVWMEAAQSIHPPNLSNSSIWLERAKLDEESGDWNRALEILLQGLHHCQSFANSPNSSNRQSNAQSIDGLACKAIKMLDRQGDLHAARKVLGSLSHSVEQNASSPINQISFIWRSLIAGCTLEARLGSLSNARRVIDCLIERSSWFGPSFVDTALLELKVGARNRSINLLRRGLVALPRFSPLYFAAVQVIREGLVDHPSVELSSRDTCHLIDEPLAPVSDNQHDVLGVVLLANTDHLARIRAVIALSLKYVSRELVWKLQLTLSLEEARFQCFSEARQALVAAARTAPKGLRFKIFIAGARLELYAIGSCSSDKTKQLILASMLLDRATEEQPQKMASTGIIERTRWYEFAGDTHQARILLESSLKSSTEWKLAFESVLLELRAGDLQAACCAAERAVGAYPLTGRLWSILVQIHMMLSQYDAAWKTFRRGLSLVPKSGELWCEGARLVLHPLSNRFSLRRAHRWIDFAIRFTPQYGDTFIEAIKLRLIAGHCHVNSNQFAKPLDLARLERLACHSQPNYGAMYQFYKSQLAIQCDQSVVNVFRQARQCIEPVIIRQLPVFQLALTAPSHHHVSAAVLTDLDYLFGAHAYSKLSDLQMRSQLDALYAADPITP